MINSEEIKEVDQGLLLVGATGAGKSTLANILAGCDMVYAESHVSVSTASSVVEQTKIGDASTSCTLKTQLVETSDWTIGDTAGLQDVRGFEFSVANAVNIVRFLGRCKNVRIMLVTALNWLETPVTRNSVALPIWKQLKEMFGENIDIALSSMIFGFTRKEFPKMLVRIKEFYTACNLRLDQVPYVLIPPPTSDVDKEEYIESIRSAINDVDPLPDCGSLVKQNVVLLEDTVGHLKMILKALSNIQSLLEKDLVKDVVDRFALIENLKFIRSQVIDEGIEEFRKVLKDFFEKISSKVNKILADKPSHHGCRKLKKLIQSLDKATILDSCFLNVDGFENFASKKKIEILNDILIKEIQLQDKTNQILKYKTDSQLALLNNAIELMSNKITKDTNFELVKSIAEVNGEVDELYDAVSIPDLRGSCSATLALLDELNREIIEFPFLYVNPIVSSLQEYRNRLFHTATMRIQELIELAKKLVREIEFKKSFDSVKLFACRIPDCDLDKLINCLMTIDGSVDQIELLNCVGFKKSDLLTMQRIGSLLEYEIQVSTFLADLTSTAKNRKTTVIVRCLDEIANSLTRDNLGKFNQCMFDLRTINSTRFEVVKEELRESIFNQISSQIDFTISNRSDDFRIQMFKHLSHLQLLKEVPLLYEEGFIDDNIKRFEKSIESSDLSFIKKKVHFFEIGFKQYVSACKGVRMALLKFLSINSSAAHDLEILTANIEDMPLEDRLEALRQNVPGTEDLQLLLDSIPRIVDEINNTCYQLNAELFITSIEQLKLVCNNEVMLLFLFLRAEEFLFVSDHQESPYTSEDVQRTFSLCASLDDDEAWKQFQTVATRILLTDRVSKMTEAIRALGNESYVKDVHLFLRNMNYIKNLSPAFSAEEVDVVVCNFERSLLNEEFARIQEPARKFTDLFESYYEKFLNTLIDFNGDFGTFSKLKLTNLSLVDKLDVFEEYFHFGDLVTFLKKSKEKVEYYDQMHYNIELTKANLKNPIENKEVLLTYEILSFQVYCQLKTMLYSPLPDLNEIKRLVDQISVWNCARMLQKVADEMKRSLLSETLEDLMKETEREFWIPKSQVQNHFDRINNFEMFSKYYVEPLVDLYTARAKKIVKDSEIHKLQVLTKELKTNFHSLFEMIQQNRQKSNWTEIKNVSWSGIPNVLDRIFLVVPFVNGLEELHNLLSQANSNLNKLQECFFFTEDGFDTIFSAALDDCHNSISQELEVLRKCAAIEVIFAQELDSIDYSAVYDDIKNSLHFLKTLNLSLYNEYYHNVRSFLFEAPLNRLSEAIELKPSEEKKLKVAQLTSFLSECETLPLSWESAEVHVALENVDSDLKAFELFIFNLFIKSADDGFKLYSIEIACQDPSIAKAVANILFTAQSSVQSTVIAVPWVVHSILQLQQMNDCIPMASGLANVFLESFCRRDLLKKVLCDSDLAAGYDKFISQELENVSRCLVSCGVSGSILTFYSLPAWSDRDINKVNLELGRLEYSDPVLTHFRSLVWDRAYDEIEIVVNRGPSESYKSSLTSYFTKLDQLHRIREGIFKTNELDQRKNTLNSKIREFETTVANDWCSDFQNQFDNFRTLYLVNVKLDLSTWIEVSKLYLKSIPSKKTDKFPVLKKFSQLKPFINGIEDLLKLFENGKEYYSNVTTRFLYFKGPSEKIMKTLYSCQEIALSSLTQLHVISKVERDIGSPNFFQSISSASETSFKNRFVKQLPFELSKMQERMTILQSSNLNSLPDYQCRLKEMFVTKPILKIQNHMEGGIDSAYFNGVNFELRILSLAEMISGSICFGGEVENDIKNIKESIRRSEDKRVKIWINDLRNALNIGLLNVLDAAETLSKNEKWCLDDFQRLNVTERRRRFSSVINVQKLENLLENISQKELTKGFFIFTDASALTSLRVNAERLIDMVLSKIKSVKAIEMLVDSLTTPPRDKDVKFQALHSEMLALLEYYKFIEKLQAEIEEDEHDPLAPFIAYETELSSHEFKKKLIYSTLFEAVQAKMNEEITIIYEVILMKKSTSYGESLLAHFELLKDVEKHLSKEETGIFKPDEIKKVVDQKLREIENEEQRGIDSLLHHFQLKFAKLNNELQDKMKKLRSDPILYNDAGWMSGIESSRSNLQSNVRSMPGFIDNFKTKGMNLKLAEPLQSQVSELQRTVSQIINETNNILELCKDLVEIEKLFPIMKNQIFAHIHTIGIYKFIECRRLTPKDLEQDFGLTPMVFKEYNELRSSFIIKDHSGLYQKELSKQLEKFLKEILIGLLCSISSELSERRLFIDYHQQLPSLFDTLKRLDHDAYLRELNSLENALTKFQTSDVQDCIQSESGIQIALLVSMFECLQSLQGTLKSHISFNIETFQLTLTSAVETMWKNGEKEAIQGFQATEDVDKFPLTSLRTYINVIHQILDKRLPIEVNRNYSSLLSTMKENCLEAFATLSAMMNAEDIKKAVLRCGWLIAKVFSLLSVLNLEKQFVLSLVQEMLNYLTPKLKEEVGRVLFDGKVHDHLGTAVNEALAAIPEFRRLHIELFNAKAKGVKFDKAIDLMKSIPPQQDNTNPSVNQWNYLQIAFEKLTESFDKHLSNFIGLDSVSEMNLINEIYSWVEKIKDAEVKVTKTNFTAEIKEKKMKMKETELETTETNRIWSFALVHQELGHLLGCIFALWAILDAKLDVPKQDEIVLLNSMMFKRPHATQVLSILKLLGVDNDQEQIQNHLAQVGTGEGKSVSLGILSVVYGLLGYEVNVICYWKYLSARDYKEFRDLFITLGIDSKIKYYEINELMKKEMKFSFPNLPNEVNSFLLGVQPNFQSRRNAKSRILLIDEVDVFFGEKYFGKSITPLLFLDHPASRQLVEYVFDHRHILTGYNVFISSTRSIKSQECYETLLQHYPNLKGLINKQISLMLRDVSFFKDDNYALLHFPRVDASISYVDEHGNRTANVYDSY